MTSDFWQLVQNNLDHSQDLVQYYIEVFFHSLLQKCLDRMMKILCCLIPGMISFQKNLLHFLHPGNLSLLHLLSFQVFDEISQCHLFKILFVGS
ncbi:hypothetical protein HanPI659440_Chr09g0325901 [Helianthus annuus]|nr:hypothetical protein HanPI659440_Chr09g0325901 [Helianthus annuus]